MSRYSSYLKVFTINLPLLPPVRAPGFRAIRLDRSQSLQMIWAHGGFGIFPDIHSLGARFLVTEGWYIPLIEVISGAW